MSKKGKSALVLGASKDKLFAVGTFLISLRKTNPNFTDDIIVFYDEIDVLEKEKFSKLGNVILKKYDCPFKKIDNLSYFVKDLFTLMVFSKYECLRLLSTYSTVVWMDYDMYVLDNIDELLTPVKEGVKAIVTEKLSDSLLEKNNPFENEKINGFHSSVFVLYDTLKNPNELYDYCIKKTIELNDILKCPEQAVFALAMKEFDIAVYPLDFRIYSNLLDEENVYNRYVKIYHTYGKNKFWNTINYEPWNECLKEWNEL